MHHRHHDSNDGGHQQGIQSSNHQTHRSTKRSSMLKLLLMSVFAVCALVIIVAHVHVAGKMKSSEANPAPTDLRGKSNAAREKKAAADKTKNIAETKRKDTSDIGGTDAKNRASAADVRDRAVAAENDNNGSQTQVNSHIIFSTTCSEQQDWESYVFFYHAFKVKQPGTVTRLASGCSEEQAKKLTEFHLNHIQTMSNRFHVHFTPDYSRIRMNNGRFPYKYMNKPYSVRNWMENVLGLNETQPVPPEIDNDVVILMDPDMILLRPLGHDFTQEPSIWAKEPDRDHMIVKHGNPIAQQDGYLSNEWVKFDMKNITQDPNTPALSVTTEQAPYFYNTGPPYLATVRDMFDIAVKWTEFAPRIFDIYPKLFAEMYGYCTATAHLKLPHTMLKSIVVSTTITRREGWAFIDSLPDDQVCNPAADAKLPFVLHYCKRYFLERFFFSKYRLRKNYLRCGTPLLTLPSNQILDVDYYVPIPEATGKQKPKPEKRPLPDRKQRKRELFMLCGLIGKINEAVIFYKQNHCDGKANFNETYNFHDYPFSK